MFENNPHEEILVEFTDFLLETARNIEVLTDNPQEMIKNQIRMDTYLKVLSELQTIVEKHLK